MSTSSSRGDRSSDFSEDGPTRWKWRTTFRVIRRGRLAAASKAGTLFAQERLKDGLERLGKAEQFKVDSLLLKLGWNQLLIQVMQRTGEWQFSGKCDGTDRSFLPALEFAAGPPDGE